ncbi:MAG: MBL fold metallo-hydrolase [Anaerolineales bacterium]|nr:MBL fold metallo-hydrolase [Anaerolineales bacterium]
MMRKFIPLSSLLLALLISGCQSYSSPGLETNPIPTFINVALDAELSIKQISPNAYEITHAYPWPANALLVEMADGSLVLVDTPYTPAATQQVIEWAEARFGERQITAINGHFHVDNLGGNAYLVEQGIPVYGSDLTVQLLAERGEANRAQTVAWLENSGQQHYADGHAAIPLVPPTHTFPLEDGLKLQFGDKVVQIIYPGPAHSLDNVVVYFPDYRLMFGGCMIQSGEEIGNTADADLEAWPASVEHLRQYDFDILVPGHGDRLDPALLDHTLDVLAKTE